MSALFPLGGVGAVFFGWLMDRFNANRIIAVGYALTALSVYLIGQCRGQPRPAGGGGVRRRHPHEHGAVVDAGAGRGVLSTQGRATGVAWMLGIGRFGGIAGSFLVAELAARQPGLRPTSSPSWPFRA